MAVALGTIAGFGVGGVYIPAATIALTASPDSLLATTGALSLSVRTIGGSIGYTIYFNVFSTRLAKRLPTALATAAAGAGLAMSEVPAFVKAFAAAPATAMNVPGVTPSILAAATRASRDSYGRQPCVHANNRLEYSLIFRRSSIRLIVGLVRVAAIRDMFDSGEYILGQRNQVHDEPYRCTHQVDGRSGK